MERIAGLADRRHPAGPGGEGFEQIGVERFRPALPERENVGRRENERQRTCADAERRRMVARKDERETGAQEKARENEQDVHSLDAPDFAVAVVAGVRGNGDHCPTEMVGRPPA